MWTSAMQVLKSLMLRHCRPLYKHIMRSLYVVQAIACCIMSWTLICAEEVQQETANQCHGYSSAMLHARPEECETRGLPEWRFPFYT